MVPRAQGFGHHRYQLIAAQRVSSFLRSCTSKKAECIMLEAEKIVTAKLHAAHAIAHAIATINIDGESPGVEYEAAASLQALLQTENRWAIRLLVRSADEAAPELELGG